MRRKLNTFSKEYNLTGEEIDQFSEDLIRELAQFGMESQNQIRIRFALEESLLRMRDHFGEETVVTLSMGNYWGRPFIEVEQEGDIFNPLSKEEVNLADWSGSLLTSVGLYPQFSYVRGRNTLRINLPVQRMNPALNLLIWVAIGLGFGILLSNVLSFDQQDMLITAYLRPLFQLWIRILSILSGPVIFFMVITTILNTGGIEEEGADSRKVIMRYFLFSMVMGGFATLVCGIFKHQELSDGPVFTIDPVKYLDILFHIVPNDLISPILNTNTPQILLFAFVLGYGIVIIGPRLKGLASIVKQINTLGLLMTDWVSLCVPFVTASLLCYEILWGKTEMLKDLWGLFLFSLIIALFCLGATLVTVSLRKKVKATVLLHKLLPAFLTTLRTGGMDEGYGEMEDATVTKLGVGRHYAEIGLQHGIILYMPINVIGTLVLTVYAAAHFNESVSIDWLVAAVVLAVVMFVATPPVPGANLLAYMMIFDFLAIPTTVLIDAMVFDVLFGLFASAGNQAMLQMDLIIQTDRIGLLDIEKLRRK